MVCGDRVYSHELNVIQILLRNHIHNEVWDEIDSTTVEV